MGIINDYLIGIQKQYPATQAVREQIEELRDTLHLKTEDLQAQGRTYDEAAREAVAALGDVKPLLDEVSGNIRTVYINRLNLKHALLSMGALLAGFLLCWLAQLLQADSPGTDYISPFFITIGIFTLFAGIWPAITLIIFRRKPDSTGIVRMNYRKIMRNAIAWWLVTSSLLIIFNLTSYTPPTAWSMWIVIFASVWPLSIYIHRRLLMGGRFDAPA